MGIKGTIFNIQRFSVHDGPGIRTIIFFKGCPIRCRWCANPESQSSRRQIMYTRRECVGCKSCEKACPNQAIYFSAERGVIIDENKCRTCGTCIEACIPMALKSVGEIVDSEEIVKEVLKDSVFFRKGGGVTLSGGEALMQSKFAAEILKSLKSLCVHTAVETCGYVDYSDIEAVRPYCDLFLYDIKETDTDKHRQYTGAGNERIIENLLRLGQTEAKIWIRMPVIVGMNDSEKDISDIAFIAGKIKNLERIELLPYHNLGVSKYEKLGKSYTISRDLNPPAQEYLYRLKEKIEERLIKKEIQVIVGK